MNQGTTKISLNSNVIVVIIITLLLFFEVFSSPIRYYFSIIGLAPLIYLPKALVAFLVLIKIITSVKVTRIHFVSVIIICFSSAIGIYNGAKITNLLFSFFMYAPFLLGYFFTDVVYSYRKWFKLLFWFFLLSSLIGVFLDFSITFPWKGVYYEVAGQDIKGNVEWSTGGIDRLAGFSRSSATLAMILSVYGMLLIRDSNKALIKILLFTLLLLGIALTTTKSVIMAYLLSILYLLFIRKSFLKKVTHFTIVLIGILLPMISIFFEYSISDKMTNPEDVVLMASLNDRFLNTWPEVFELIKEKDSLLTGVGFGTVGSAARIFPIQDNIDLSVTDSTSLYLYSMFGLLGIYLYYRFYYLLNKSSNKYQSLLVCIVCIAWATDIFESVTIIFFLGHILSERKKQKIDEKA